MTERNINTLAQLLDHLNVGYYKNNTKLVNDTYKRIKMLETVHSVMDIFKETTLIIKKATQAN